MSYGAFLQFAQLQKYSAGCVVRGLYYTSFCVEGLSFE